MSVTAEVFTEIQSRASETFRKRKTTYYEGERIAAVLRILAVVIVHKQK